MLETLNLFLTGEVLRDCLGALLLRNNGSLLGWVVKLNLHLVHLLHGRLVRGGAVGPECLRLLRLGGHRSLRLWHLRHLDVGVSPSEPRLRHNVLVFHAGHSKGVLLILAQVDLDSGLRAAGDVLRCASIRAHVVPLYSRRSRRIVVPGVLARVLVGLLLLLLELGLVHRGWR